MKKPLKKKSKFALMVKEFGKLLPDNKSHMNRIQIKSSSSNRLYIVAQNNTYGVHHRRWECSCPGWVFKKPNKPRNCRHLKAMMPDLMLVGALKKIGSRNLGKKKHT